MTIGLFISMYIFVVCFGYELIHILNSYNEWLIKYEKMFLDFERSHEAVHII